MLSVSLSTAWAVAVWALAAIFHEPGVVAAEPNYYEVLEIPEDASQDEVRKAYKRQALKWHPDRNRGDPTAENRFRELAATYEVLSDPKRRQQYDLARRGGGGEFNLHDFNFDFADFGGFAFSDPLDLFKDLFEGGDAFSGFDQFFQGGDFFSGFDQMFQGFDQHFQGFEQQFQQQDLFEGLEQILHGGGGGGGGADEGGSFASSFFSSFSFASSGGAPKSKHVETAFEASSRETADLLSREGRCAADDALGGHEPRDIAVDHVAGSACCNARPRTAATDTRGCCQRCAESPDCEVFVLQPSTGSCWLLRWRPGIPRAAVRTTDRVMGDFVDPSHAQGSARE